MDTIIISLSKRGKHAGKYEAIVDEIDKDLADLNWSVRICRLVSYAYRKLPGKHGQNEHLHRVILQRILGRKLLSTEQVDHINGDGLDNRRENLRVATHGQNLHNRAYQRNNVAGLKGVSITRSKKWRARIAIDGKQIWLGVFDTPEEAYQAYCEAAKHYHGEFARTK